MRAGEIVIMNQTPLLLSEDKKKLVCDKWERDVNKLKVPLPSKIRDLVRYIISHCDFQGVLFGSVEQLAREVEMPRHQARAGLQALERANLLKRKNGITIVTDERLWAL